MDDTLRERYAAEPWGKLAIAAGFNPVNTESSARHAFRFCADRIETLEALLVRAMEREYNSFEPDNQSAFYQELRAALGRAAG